MKNIPIVNSTHHSLAPHSEAEPVHFHVAKITINETGPPMFYTGMRSLDFVNGSSESNLRWRAVLGVGYLV
jgi:hypothetical protein